MSQDPRSALHLLTTSIISVVTQRCPEGVELADPPSQEIGEATVRGDVALAGPTVRFKSPNRDELRLYLHTLENLVALRFINARSDAQLLSFFQRYGLLIADFPIEVSGARSRQGSLENAFRTLLINDTLERPKAREWFARSLNKVPPLVQLHFGQQGSFQFELRGRSLWQFMALEIAAAAAKGVRLHECANCGDAFITGPLTGRREHAKFCSDKCRVKHFRQSAKRKAESQGEPDVG
jgi:hypothetical protein